MSDLLHLLTTAPGIGKVSLESNELSAHQTDWWPIATKWKLEGRTLPSPLAVIYPESVEEVVSLLEFANTHNLKLVPYGLGSGVVGGAMAVQGAITVNTSRMNKIIALDELSMVVTVQAGLRGSELETYLNARGYTTGHYPQSLSLSSVGGWLATRASGTFSAKFGNIEDIVVGLVAVAGNGKKIVVTPSPRKSAGPDIAELLLGSEGTLAFICEITLAIYPLQQNRPLAAYSFPDVATGLVAIRKLAQSDFCPALVRLNDVAGSQKFMQFGIEKGSCVLVLSWDGPSEVVETSMNLTHKLLVTSGGTKLESKVAGYWFDNRFNVSHLEEAIATPGRIADTTEMSCLWKDSEAIHHAITELFVKHDISATCHFSHVYHTGTSLYWTYHFADEHLEKIEERYFTIWNELMRVTLAHNGAISHHHGLGTVRAKWLALASPSTTFVLEALKQEFDPKGLLNPGRLGLSKL
ncbi:MAG: FAD-binding oxidoreductase [Trueperaceae bacterium]|nr:FAD-binding oxidoreductase [Trueperaceae bacterium]